jgi:glucokinase
MPDATLTIDLGGTQIRSAVAADGVLRGRVARPTPAAEGPAVVVDEIVAAVHESLAAADAAQAPTGVGIAAPGPLSGTQGVVFSPPNLHGWTNVPLAALLGERLGLPVTLIKDTNAAAIAESRMGAAKGFSTLIYVTISTGIGGGLILGGKLYEGPDGTAGEVGHVTIDRNGPLCECGNRGCVEAIASGSAIARRATTLVTEGKLILPPGVRPSAEGVFKAALAGNEEAQAIANEVGWALGLALVGLVHLFNPQCIVLGGGMMHAGPLLLDPIRVMLARHAMPIPRESVHLVTATLGDDVGLWGAAMRANDVQGAS